MRYTVLMLSFILSFNFSMAQETTRTEDFYRGDDFVSGTPAPQVVAQPPPAPARPRVRTEPARPSVPVTGGQGGVFTDTSQRDQAAPIFPKFQQVFSQCAEGCNAGRAHCYGSRGGRSCHPSGNAIDVHSLICNGVTYNAYSDRFKRFVECVSTKSHNGTRWRALYQQTTTRNNCHLTSRNHTTCHWDHAHFSLGCWVNGRQSY